MPVILGSPASRGPDQRLNDHRPVLRRTCVNPAPSSRTRTWSSFFVPGRLLQQGVGRAQHRRVHCGKEPSRRDRYGQAVLGRLFTRVWKSGAV